MWIISLRQIQKQRDCRCRSIDALGDIQGRLISPGEFIPIMEENTMIYNAGLWKYKRR